MEWLTLDQALAQNFQVRGSPPQQLEFPVDLADLSAQVPVPAHFEEMGFVPSPSFQWYGRIGDRPLILERERDMVSAGERVFVHTSYLSKQDELGDWTVLLDLGDLPSAIHVTRPTFILSRTLKPEHVVFRPDAEGFNAIIYNAASRRDAEGLLEFLKKDSFNEHCFIGPSSLVRHPY